MMAGKDQTLYFVQTNGRQGSPVPFVAGGQPGELPFSPTRDDFPLVVSKKAEARQHVSISMKRSHCSTPMCASKRIVSTLH